MLRATWPLSFGKKISAAYSNPLGYGANIANDPGFDDPAAWVTSSGWSVTGGQAVGSSAGDSLRQNGILQAGKFYRVEFDYIANSGSGKRLRLVDNTGRRLYTTQQLDGASPISGTITCVIAPDGTDLLIQGDTVVFNGSISRIEVRELIYNDSRLGPEKVTNGGFASSASWAASGGWSISGGTANGSSATSRLVQTGVFVIGETYRIVLKIRRSGGLSGARIRVLTETGGAVALSTGYALDTTFTLNANHTLVVTTFVADGTELRIEADTAAFTGLVDDISVQKVL